MADDLPESIEQADIELGLKIASHRHDERVKAAAEVGKVGDQEPLYAISALVALCGQVSGNRRLRAAGAYMFAAIGAADLSKRVVKSYVKRTRPHVLMDQGRYEVDAGGSPVKPEQSFPSGHAAGSVAVVRACGRFFPASLPFTGLGALIVGIARMAKGAHWPLDVAAGCVIGWFAELASNAVMRRLWPLRTERGRWGKLRARLGWRD